MIVLDTHVLLWLFKGERKLGRGTRSLIHRWWPSGKVAASAISFWEVATLLSRGRIDLPDDAPGWRAQVLTAGLVELPLDGQIAIRAADLGGAGDDPADRMIAATALQHQAILVTADERLLDWRHPLERKDASK